MSFHSLIIQEPFYGRPFHYPRDGDAKDDLIYEKGVAFGIYLACVAEKAPSHVYNLGTGVGHTLRDMAEVVRKYLPNADIEIGPGPQFLPHPHMHGIYDISRARKELGFQPQFPLERAVGDYLDTLRRMRTALNPSVPYANCRLLPSWYCECENSEMASGFSVRGKEHPSTPETL